MNNEQVHKCVPTQRFPEFKNDGEWEKSFFSDVLDFLPNNTLSRADLNYDKGVVKNIHYGDVLIKFGESLDVKESDLPFISDEKNAQKASQGALKNGDVVIADTAEDEVVGKCTEVTNLTNEIVVSGLHTIPARPNVPFASSFLGFYLNSESYRKQLKPLMQGIKVIAISKGALCTTKVVYPKNIEEQRKIADCLSSMNDLISATKNKLELLKKQKNGLMQKLFPANGKTVPEIRFKEFEKDGEWVEEFLGNIGPVSMCKRILKEQTDMSYPIPFYKIRTFGRKADAFISEKLYNEYREKYSFPSKGDVLISAAGTIGRTVVYDGLPAYFQDSNIVWIANNEQIVLNIFLRYVYSLVKWHIDDGGVVKRLYNESIRQTVIMIPSQFEQKKIAECLLLVEELISLFAQKTSILEKQKEGLMQGIFSNLE